MRVSWPGCLRSCPLRLRSALRHRCLRIEVPNRACARFARIRYHERLLPSPGREVVRVPYDPRYANENERENRSRTAPRSIHERIGGGKPPAPRRPGAVSPGKPLLSERIGQLESFVDRTAFDTRTKIRAKTVRVLAPPRSANDFRQHGPLARASLSRLVSIRVPRAGSRLGNQGSAVNSAVESMGWCQFGCRDYAFDHKIDRNGSREGARSRSRHPN